MWGWGYSVENTLNTVFHCDTAMYLLFRIEPTHGFVSAHGVEKLTVTFNPRPTGKKQNNMVNPDISCPRVTCAITGAPSVHVSLSGASVAQPQVSSIPSLLLRFVVRSFPSAFFLGSCKNDTCSR